MRISFLIILFLWLNLGLTQDKKIGFGLIFYPSFSAGYVSMEDTNSTFYTGIETMAFSYSMGFEMNYFLSNEWGISTGLRFQKIGDRSKAFPPDLSRGLIYERNYIHRHFFFELPIEVFKTFNERWHITFGISPLLKLWDRGLLFTGGGNGIKIDAQTYTTGKLGITGNLGFGYSLNLKNSILRVLPYTQLNFTKPLEEVPSIDLLPARRYASFGLRISYIL